MHLLGTGLSGMVGGTVVHLLNNEYTFQNLSLEVGIDITDPVQVEKAVSKTEAEWILHFAAVTNVDQAEKERQLGEHSITWKVNVDATQSLVDACIRYHKKLLFISTDFVFHGDDVVYTEKDTPDPVGWYAATKYEAEKRVSQLGNQSVIMRIAFPYGSIGSVKKDFVGRLRQLLETNTIIKSPVDQIMTPTYIPDIASAIDACIKKNSYGLYHVVGSSWISSYDAVLEIADVFGYNKDLVQKTTVKEYYAEKAPRANVLKIDNSAYRTAFGLTPLPFHQGISQLKEIEK